VLHDNRNIHVAFRVEDRFVRCVHERYQSMVCEDSCVEFFVEPRPGRGYFNFEINGGGTMLLYFIEDPNPGNGKLFRKFREVPIELGGMVKIQTSLPARIDPEITESITWMLKLSVPREVLEAFAGPLGDWSGQQWRGNLFKCGDKTSQPHWASWAPIGSELAFHNPAYFAAICLG
jgi:Carbohydrate-binding family 9